MLLSKILLRGTLWFTVGSDSHCYVHEIGGIWVSEQGSADLPVDGEESKRSLCWLVYFLFGSRKDCFGYEILDPGCWSTPVFPQRSVGRAKWYERLAKKLRKDVRRRVGKRLVSPERHHRNHGSGDISVADLS
jgi:hypothetical protein